MRLLLVRLLHLTLFASALRGSAHEHINAGAQSQAEGTPLFFQNAGSYNTNSGFVFMLTRATNGPYAGFFQTTALSFTSIGLGFFDPPASGTLTRLRFVALTGPAGGSFGIWDVPGFNEEQEPSGSLAFSLPAGTTNGANSILLSENDGEPGADPGGHIHGRAYSATLPGLYVVLVQAYDASANGPGGSPLHTPSALLPIYFHAGNSITSFTCDGLNFSATFPTAVGSTYYVQTTTNLAPPAVWQDASGPITGNNHFQAASAPLPDATAGYFRLRVTTP